MLGRMVQRHFQSALQLTPGTVRAASLQRRRQPLGPRRRANDEGENQSVRESFGTTNAKFEARRGW
jgi:hypothetical protein